MSGHDDGDRALETLLDHARGGDRDALEQVVRAIQDPVYGLAMRMLAVPAEAEDATQEILIKVVTRLDSFRGESRFTTWVYAVAANHLRTVRAGRLEGDRFTFEAMSRRQAEILPDATAPGAERVVMNREIKLMCLHGVLLCLDREHRLAYVLGETLGLSGVEGAQVLGISAAAFRKRLSRARGRLKAFMTDHCGLVSGENRCRCELWCQRIEEAGLVDEAAPVLAGHPALDAEQETALEGLDELQRIVALFRSLPEYRAPRHLIAELNRILTVSHASSPEA